MMHVQLPMFCSLILQPLASQLEINYIQRNYILVFTQIFYMFFSFFNTFFSYDSIAATIIHSTSLPSNTQLPLFPPSYASTSLLLKSGHEQESTGWTLKYCNLYILLFNLN